jgi:hypothetical protein
MEAKQMKLKGCQNEEDGLVCTLIIKKGETVNLGDVVISGNGANGKTTEAKMTYRPRNVC